MTLFGNVFHWLGGIFKKAEDDIAKASVVLVKDIIPILESGSATVVADILDAVTKSQLPTDILDSVRAKIPVFLSAESIVSEVSQATSEDQVQADISKLVQLFPNLEAMKRSQFLSTLAANIYWEAHKLSGGEQLTFADVIIIIEHAYQAYVAS